MDWWMWVLILVGPELIWLLLHWINSAFDDGPEHGPYT